MKEYKLALEEQETYLRIDPVSRTWYAEAMSPKYIRKFEKMGWKKVREVKYQDGTVMSAEFEAPEFAVSIRQAEKTKRELSEEQQEQFKKRMEKVRAARTE